MENSWIHDFPKGISAKWNANDLVQDLNSGSRYHFYDDSSYAKRILGYQYSSLIGDFKYQCVYHLEIHKETWELFPVFREVSI